MNGIISETRNKIKKEQNKLRKHLQNRRFVLPLQSQKGNGSLDEWLSQRSAKPCTAVRIRQEPLEILATYTENQLGGKDFFYPYLPFSDSTQEAVNVTTN